MAKEIKVDYYSVEVPHGRTFKTLLEEAGSPPLEERVMKREDYDPIRLDDFNSGNEEVTGDIVRIRMEALPPKETLTGERTTIEFRDNEGLGEATAFLYVPKLNILVFQYNHTGVRASAFCRYLSEKTRLNGTVNLLPVLRKDAFEEMKKLSEVRELVVDMAGVKSLSALLDATEQSTEEAVELIPQFRAPTVKIVITMGRIKGSLPNFFKDLAVKLSGKGAPEDRRILKLQINGKNEGGEKRFIDLLKYRMEDRVEVATLPRERLMSYSSRCDALRRAFNSRQDELVELYQEE